MQRETGATLFDGLLLLAIAGVVVLVLLPGWRVGAVLDAEDRAMDYGRELAARIDAARDAAERDLDGNGVGETPSIGEVVRPEDNAIASAGGTAVRKDGYWFTVLVAGAGRMPSQPSDDPRLAPLSETTYALLAWPVEPGKSGMRAYLRTPHGGLLRHAIDGYPYGDGDRPPLPRTPLVETRGGAPRPLTIAGDTWVAPRETLEH